MAIELNCVVKNIKVEIDLPASKSINNRVLIIDALSGYKSKLKNVSSAQDTVTLKKILKQFRSGTSTVFDVGHAGTTMRFLTAFFCMQKGEQTLTGSSRMKERPIKILVDALRSLGAEIDYPEKDGFPPLLIKEALPTKNSIQIDGGVSSQYISALMLIAPYLPNGLTVDLQNEVVSRSYIKMTENIMKHFSAEVHFEKNTITISNKNYKPNSFFVEGDWSGASYWYSIAALSDSAQIKINSLKKSSVQGDNIVSEIYKKFGVTTEFFEDAILIKKVGNFDYDFIFEHDFSDCPDLAQTVVITCLALKLKAKLTSLKTLNIKETNRLQALKNECEKLGAQVNITNDSLELIPNNLRSCTIETYDDHRMAMAFAPLALKIDGLKINDEQVVKKSYPNFWQNLAKSGFLINPI